MKNIIIALSLIVLASCSPNEEESKNKSKDELKIESERIFNNAEAITAFEPCIKLEAYRKLQVFESKYNTTFYSQITSQKLKFYKKECYKFQKPNDKKSWGNSSFKSWKNAPTNKLGKWSTGRYVDEFGDITNKGFIKLTGNGSFSNSAISNATLKVELMLSNGSLVKPWFRFYEHGSNPVQGVYNDRNFINCNVKGNSNIFEIQLYQAKGWDNLQIMNATKTLANVEKLRALVVAEKVAKFSCHRQRKPSNKYRFDLNFKNFVYALIEYER